jgi:hypothetical protein
MPGGNVPPLAKVKGKGGAPAPSAVMKGPEKDELKLAEVVLELLDHVLPALGPALVPRGTDVPSDSVLLAAAEALVLADCPIEPRPCTASWAEGTSRRTCSSRLPAFSPLSSSWTLLLSRASCMAVSDRGSGSRTPLASAES